jgi:hypothetical protein
MSAKIRRQIVREWPDICKRARMPHALPFLPKSPKLFGQSHKVDLGLGLGVSTRVVYLAPASSGFAEGDTRTLCVDSTPECRAVCLGEHSGLLVTSTSERSRLWKSALLLGGRALFRALLVSESASHVRACEANGKLPALRVDGSSDTAEGRVLAAELASRGITAYVYDYTKNAARALRNASGADPGGYHLTYSYSGSNAVDCKRVLHAGGIVAVAFDTPRGEALPVDLWGFEVTDADLHDARFRDPRGTIAGLRFKTARDRAAMLAKAGAFVFRVAEPLRLAA